LPLFVRESFPFVLSHKAAIHRDVVEELTDNLVHAKGFSAPRAALEQAHHRTFHAKDLKYCTILLWRRQIVFRRLATHTAERAVGSFDDPEGYNGFVPSEHYLSSMWSESSCSREDVIQQRQQQVDGTVLKVDESRKLVKFVRVFDAGAAGTAKPVHCVITFFNDFEQVCHTPCSRPPSGNSSQIDLKSMFATRYKGRGFKLPSVLYTDMCCDDRTFMMEIF
ncbi:unnamed protein product, partial [Hapterophycus canaliculatus]